MLTLCDTHKGWTLRLSDCPVCRVLEAEAKARGSSMQYLAIFEDGTIKQIDNIEEGDAQSVDGGYLDIVRFNADTGKYERYDPVVVGGNVLSEEWSEL